MAINYPGPYELVFPYQVAGLEHVMRISVMLDSSPVPGTSFTLINGLTGTGNTPILSQWVDDYLVELGKQFDTQRTTFGAVELWKYEPLSFEKSFVSSHPAVSQPTSAAQYNEGQQTTFTFRTQEGGIMKIVLLDSVNDAYSVHTYPTPFSNPSNFMQFVTDQTASIIVARDTSRPFSPLRMSNGQNEKSFRRRHRS